MSAQPMRGMFRVNVNLLTEHPANVREDIGDVTDLAASIRANGLLQPIVAEQIDAVHWKVLAGHRRLAAVKQLGWPQVPVLLHAETSADQALVLMLVENSQRRNLDPIEEAHAMRALCNQGLTQTEVARRIGKRQSDVNARLALLDLSEEEQQDVRDGALTIGSGLAVVRERRKDPRGNRSGNTGHHFTKTHPLAGQARARCQSAHDETPARLLGAVACGPCFEAVIREDAVLEHTTRDPGDTTRTVRTEVSA